VTAGKESGSIASRVVLRPPEVQGCKGEAIGSGEGRGEEGVVAQARGLCALLKLQGALLSLAAGPLLTEPGALQGLRK